MKIKALRTEPYKLHFKHGLKRVGNLLCLQDEHNRYAWGDIAPLPERVKRFYKREIDIKKNEILKADWRLQTYHNELLKLKLHPTFSFAFESALLCLLSPLDHFSLPISAFFAGTASEILDEAEIRKKQGYKIAKVKIGDLTTEESFDVLTELKRHFRLRVDVNRCWDCKKAIQFFSRFPVDSFEYVEEPCKDSEQLKHFPHPVAIDESFPTPCSLEKLEKFPSLKALIYKPTVHGGITYCSPILQWAKSRSIDLVLGSSFESDVGHAHIASMAHRLSVKTPVGLGTYHYLQSNFLKTPLQSIKGQLHVPGFFHANI